ncbi:PRD domain-containing protein, partial [Bacillus sp. WP8]|uniref:PRD domain-containing protein n=1 Tax=Bacillus sp. WP8 TaxID=756828 RepID=UPI0011A727B0
GFKENLRIENGVVWEVKKFYGEEFRIGVDGVEVIEKELGIEVGEEEGGNIGFDVVNGEERKDNLNEMVMMRNMVKEILNIMKMDYKMEIGRDRIN